MLESGALLYGHKSLELDIHAWCGTGMVWYWVNPLNFACSPSRPNPVVASCWKILLTKKRIVDKPTCSTGRDLQEALIS